MNSTDLRDLADKLDSLNLIENWCPYIRSVTNVTVNWPQGSAVPGYSKLSRLIANLVECRWNDLRLEAIQKLRDEIAILERELRQ